MDPNLVASEASRSGLSGFTVLHKRIYSGPYMSVQVLLNLINELRKSNKM